MSLITEYCLYVEKGEMRIDNWRLFCPLKMFQGTQEEVIEV